MTGVPPPQGARRAPVISPLVLADRDTAHPAAAQAVLTDEHDHRVVLVELRLTPGSDPDSVKARFQDLFARVFRVDKVPEPVPVGRHYMRCVLTPDQVERLVRGGSRSATAKSVQQALELIYHIWPDLVVHAHTDQSLTTIKADAALRTYNCGGTGVVWGVLDSGIDATHPHFAANDTLCADAVKNLHRDFTITTSPGAAPAPLVDKFGHGTHVAGIIAGAAPADSGTLRIATNQPTAQGLPQWASRTLAPGTFLSGVAPKANLVSLKVLDDNGKTLSSVIIDALDYVRTVNSYGRDMQIHGVNLSLGCGWLPRDYAAGQSPLCRELDLLVGTGVVAVVSAGNSGAGSASAGVGTAITGMTSDVYGQLSTITDPGNAAEAITVGSVHRSRPHTYGITFDSSKGPTLDGRRKPDLVAPGERITSAATGLLAQGVPPLAGAAGDPKDLARYIEDSGTSMAAAHVSGAVAAFLSARREYIGQPQLVKQLLHDTATDLGRHEFFQGAGLVDLMRALSGT
jgi:subtilisin family serine protease